MNQKIFKSAFLAIGLIAISFIAIKLVNRPYQQLKQVADRQQVQIAVGDQSLLVEVVNTPQSRAQGLSQREEIGADGMLFVLDKKRVPSFWMKQMKFDLDLVWINQDRVIEVTRSVPAPDSQLQVEDLPRYQPSQAAEMVLELTAGAFEIQVGDQVRVKDKTVNYFNIW